MGTAVGVTIPEMTNLTAPEEVLREGIEQSLRAHLSENAIFLAELLTVSYPSASSSNILARSHLQKGDLTRAANALYPPANSANAYLYALCCYRIGTPERLREAEEVLRSGSGAGALRSSAIPGGSAGQYLLAQIYHQTARKDAAVEFYQRALRANPTLWVAFSGLVSVGLGASRVDAVFSHATDTSARALLRAQPFATPNPPPPPAPQHNLATPNALSPRTPSAHTLQSQQGQQQLQPSPRRRLRGLNSMARVHSAPSPRSNVESPGMHGYITPRAQYTEENASSGSGISLGRIPAMRRVTRTNQHHVGSPAAGGKHEVQSKLFATPNSTGDGARKKNSLRRKGVSERTSVVQPTPREDAHPPTPTPLPVVNDAPEIMDIIRKLGKAVAAVGRYQCNLAVKLAEALPQPHSSSAFAYALRGRAHLEGGRFSEACTWYRRAVDKDPNSIALVAARYSTALWHTKDAEALASLAARAMRFAPVPPGAWVAAGNSASLQREGEVALRFFQRAARMVPRDAYAHTLVGHELAAKEDFEGALSAFRAGLAVDDRCYPALYGVAQVLHKQEQYVLSERHYRAALAIHPRNAFLHYHLALALAARAAHVAAKRERSAAASTVPPANDLLPALDHLDHACRLDPDNPVAAFERAKLLAKVGRVREAREALISLRDTMPREAEVHYELARLDRKLGDYAPALRSIVLALSFGPRERRYKKESESLNLAVNASNSL